MTTPPTDANANRMRWMEWNRQGFIPGPDETEQAYHDRIVFCQNLEQHLKDIEGAALPFEFNDDQSQDTLKEALPLTQSLYGIVPEWVPIFFSNYQLAPWHGGCAWIFQLTDKTPTSAFLQLRAKFRCSSTFLRIYHRKELIAHETAHVGRMLYQEPKFEEFFAYQSSSSSWRKWMGPIVQSSKESFFFIFLLGVVVLSDLALISLGPQATLIALGIKLLPLIFIALAFTRLTYRHGTLKKCLQKLTSLFPPDQARHLCYRLRDSEIQLFSKSTPVEIQKFIKNQADLSFRWLFFKTIYLT